ncbi:hydroxyisourate hydrolase [Saccharomonospora saliphila]|uniref:hydroxyisourate hydrolase n=1 Tax=Saccharomonospora saliphila TaxID=369829 RepID=UPI000379778F|nr:hydroxyisourate hydrolase [Saccharomonospora saliphila]
MSAITTHVLDTALGRPAAGVRVRLERVHAPGESGTRPGGTVLAEESTNGDGRVPEFGPDEVDAGTYRVVFDTAGYFAATGQDGFFPEVTVTFVLTDPAQHYHIPLLLSPFAYSTYRGS